LFFISFYKPSLSLSFGSASVSELATAVGVNLVSVRSLQKISALFDLRDSQFKLHFSGLKCLVSVLILEPHKNFYAKLKVFDFDALKQNILRYHMLNRVKLRISCEFS
jgi:hypothetical protein